MTAGINRYKADLRELFFVLFEQFRFDQVAGTAPFDGWGVDEAKAVLQETYRLAREVLGPLNGSADREGCRLDKGAVYTPKGFKDAWNQLYEAGFKSLGISRSHGGQNAPTMLTVITEELLSGANTAFNMYPGLTTGALELIAECGSSDQVHRYVEKMGNGKWGGTMCLTEPHAGSDVGAAKTTAKKNSDGTYSIRGTKIFISAGDHDLTENIIHMVLARVEGAPPGTKGLSLFVVPKRRINADGSAGASNDVSVASIEHKMGINGSSTCVLNFGDNGQCHGELLGNVENAGMSQMFKMMNGARIGVGLQGLAIASAAYQSALDYAKDRKQGPNYKHFRDATAPRVAIIEHPDVRRMLLDLKAHTEGIRMLLVKLAMHLDKSKQLAGTNDELSTYHKGQVELLTPLLKAYATDEAFRLTGEAIQVYGGAGYLKDHPVEQYCRDSKIMSIYEGTNHIQAMDLVGRKMGQAGGAHLQQFMGDITAFIEQNQQRPGWGPSLETLGKAQQGVMQGAMALMGWSQEPEKFHLIALNANRMLTMMSRLAVGWLLLDAAILAEKAGAELKGTHPDKAFYEGKKYSALWYARNILPQVEYAATLFASEDSTPMEIPDAAFASEG